MPCNRPAPSLVPSRPLMAIAALAAALAAGGCTYSAQDRGYSGSDAPMAARVTGPTVSCIPLSQFSNTRVRDSRTIDFLTTSRRGWRTTLPASCPNLTSNDAFSYATSLSQLCSTDIIRPLVSTGGTLQPLGACGLGEFTPIELAR